MKYIFVTGGVISGIGKGVCSSSIGVILKARNIKVTSIKIDPYINIDAGTFSPYEHGEVFVLGDGGEVDLDLGNYERFLDITLTRDNNITTGKIYQTVINRERRGDYLGKTVQVVPHITDEIMQWLERVANRPVENANGDTYMPDVCIVELGGIIGDIESMPYIEAVRQFQTRAHRENVLVVHVSLVPAPRTTGEHKTKPTQRSVHELRGLGLSPDLLFCRSETPLNDPIKHKLSMFCDVPSQRIISVEDVDCLYEVPLVLERQKVANFIIDRFGFSNASNNLPTPSTVDSFAAFHLYDTDTDADADATPNAKARDSPPTHGSGKAVRDELRNVALTNSAASRNLTAPANGASVRLGNSASVPNLANSLNLSQPVLQPPNRFLKKWQTIVDRYKSGAGNEVRIALVGKYVRLHDAYTSVIAAIEHAGVHAKARVKIEYVNAEDLEPACAVTRASDYHKACLLLEHSHGVLVPGGFDQRGVDGKLAAIRHARERRKPFLGICLGLQCAVIEMARNVCQLSDANSAEFNRNTAHPVVIEMPEFNPETKGATMRLGKRRTVFQREYPDSVTKRLYRAVAAQSLGERARSAEYVDERHRHRFEVNPIYIERLQKAGMRFVGKDETGERMEILELAGHPYFVGTQYHPEYQSRPLRPSAPYLGLILAALSAANEQQSAAVGVSMSSDTEVVDASLPRELDRFLRKAERKWGHPSYASSMSSALHLTKNGTSNGVAVNGTSNGVAVNGDTSSATSAADSDDMGQELDHPSPSPPESLTANSETAAGLSTGRANAALESHQLRTIKA